MTPPKQQYQDLGPEDVIQAGDEFQTVGGWWKETCEESIGKACGALPEFKHRRPIPASSEEKGFTIDVPPEVEDYLRKTKEHKEKSKGANFGTYIQPTAASEEECFHCGRHRGILISQIADFTRQNEELKMALEDQHHATDGLHNTVNSLRAELDAATDELKKVREALRQIERSCKAAIPNEGAWETSCPLCDGETDCGSIPHTSECPLIIAQSALNKQEGK